MNASSEKDWAARYYRVERASTGMKTSRRKLKRIAEQAARFGDPIPQEAHDVVRIYDRQGAIVMQRDWGQNRDAAVAEEARIVEDLLHLDVVQFRARHGIVEGISFDEDDLEDDDDEEEAGPAESTTEVARAGVPDPGSEGNETGAPG